MITLRHHYDLPAAAVALFPAVCHSPYLFICLFSRRISGKAQISSYELGSSVAVFYFIFASSLRVRIFCYEEEKN